MLSLHRLAAPAAALLLACAVAACGPGATDLALDLRQGERYGVDYEVDSSMAMTMDMGGQAMAMTTDQEQVLDLMMTATEVGPSGTTLEGEYTDVSFSQSMDASVAGQSMPGLPPEADEMAAEIARALDGMPFTMRLAPDRSVISLEVPEKELAAMREAVLVDLAGPQREMLRGMLDQTYDPEAMAQGAMETWQLAPPEPVKPGDTWTATRRFETAMPLTVESTFKLLSMEDGVATIEEEATLVASGMPPALEAMPFSGEMNLSGTQTGVYTLDLGTGWLLTGNITQNLTGNMTMGGGPLPMEMSIPMEGTNTITLTGYQLGAE
jgi:hypothetical protein